MTPSGVERDLKKSPYTETLEYNGHMVTYIFSCSSALDKFRREYQENRRYIRNSLQNRFRMKFVIGDDLCDLTLYRKIERRGFRIEIDGRPYEWLGQIEYNGQKLTEKKSLVK